MELNIFIWLVVVIILLLVIIPREFLNIEDNYSALKVTILIFILIICLSNAVSYFRRYYPINNNFNPIFNIFSCYKNNYEVDELNGDGTIKYENKDITIMSSIDKIIYSNHLKIRLSNKQMKEIYSPYSIKVYTVRRNICNSRNKTQHP